MSGAGSPICRSRRRLSIAGAAIGQGTNLYGNSIVAVDAATGRYKWHFQVVHHDIWDVDLPAATLIDVKKNGRTIPAIAVMSKMAIMFILDRVTGKPLYDVTEVPVPQETDIPGEKPWPTQPMPSAPPPLTRLSFEMSRHGGHDTRHQGALPACRG